MDENQNFKSLPVAALSVPISATDFEFETTSDIPAVNGWLGQDRAVDAIRMSAAIKYSDFNAFVLGTPGSGRRSVVRSILKEATESRACPSDWVYVNNFLSPDKPTAIELPSGHGIRFRKAMETLIDELANDIPTLFESEDYQSKRTAIEHKYGELHETAMGEVFENARTRNVAILRTPIGFTVTGIKDGEVITAEAYNAMNEEQRSDVDKVVEKTQEELAVVLKSFPALQKEHRHEIENLNYTIASEGVDVAIKAIRKQFVKIDAAQKYFDDVRQDIIENADEFLLQTNEIEAGPFPVATSNHYAKPQFTKYRINVIVSNDPKTDTGAPIIEEELPTLANLIGRIEFESRMGALSTDFSLIKPGALHLANGGFLTLDARKVLSEPFAWDALKQCLKSGKISIYSIGERLSYFSTVSLTPEPIPLDVRVILVGERLHYYLLCALDPEFSQLFKLEADFNDHLSVVDGSTNDDYAQLIGSIAKGLSIRPLDPSAMVRMFQESARLTNDAERLTLNVNSLSDILREADFWASEQKCKVISAAQIDKVITENERRVGRVRDLSQEAINRNTILIDTDGARIGQVNALSVLQLGGYSFGRPSRLTARTRMGAGKVVDIEREAELSGPIHSKGMLILQGYLASTFATDEPMSLWASLVFEQSYGQVDGDSASAAELLALLSSLAEAPIDQSFAMTGSVNQFGDIQAIGGVNEKIEGYFDTCSARGLTGSQGVLIPSANVKHLSLRQRVVDAVGNGTFKIIPMKSISDAIEIMTGLRAGSRNKSGNFPRGSLNWRVERQLRAFAKARKEYSKSLDAGKDK